MVKNIKTNTKKLIAFLASLCLFLSAIEYVIPKPLPFMRLGLANMPIIIAIFLLKPRQILFLVLLKVIGQGFITGTFFSYIFVFSLFGSFAACFAMMIVHRIGKTYVSSVGISISGSLANAAVQIFLSEIVLYGDATQYIAPILTISASVTGFFLGMCTTVFLEKSQWYIQRMEEQNSQEYMHE